MKMSWWIIAGLFTAGSAFAEPTPKLGFVDLQRALNESEAGKKAKDEFKVQVDKLQATLKKKKDTIDGLKDQLEKKGLVMKDEERNTLEEDYRKRLRDFERDYKDSQADLQRKDNGLTGAILKDLQDIIRDYGEREGYTLIFEASSNAVLYGTKSIDVTDAIMEHYNSGKKKK